ncbi:hypothetical protein [Aureimonas populi]|uniref:Uncharacterized protein n=1 Tax=Aureimonas populi TaxID=1701758 RepID=A0ABW5CGF1_9HYPH|nr:hypothetical protein [Aureimonas populi]
MSLPDARPVLLEKARPSDFYREGLRRVNGWLASLPDGREWTRMDVVFAGIVALLALSSTGFFTTAYRIWSNDPDYFSRRMIASLQQGGSSIDLIETGTVANAAEADGTSGALPVPRVVRDRELSPADYEIVMIFGGEALLATARELMRAKVGSVLPGLGAILSVSEEGVAAQNATLKPVPVPAPGS